MRNQLRVALYGKGQQSALTVQLEAAKEAAAEQEREKERKTDEANRLHADVARWKAEKEGATEQLAAAREARGWFSRR